MGTVGKEDGSPGAQGQLASKAGREHRAKGWEELLWFLPK